MWLRIQGIFWVILVCTNAVFIALEGLSYGVEAKHFLEANAKNSIKIERWFCLFQLLGSFDCSKWRYQALI